MSKPLGGRDDLPRVAYFGNQLSTGLYWWPVYFALRAVGGAGAVVGKDG